MSIQRVVLIGASGNVGRRILNQLLIANFKVTAVTRSTSSTTFPAGVAVARLDPTFPHDQLVSTFTGHDAVISAILARDSDPERAFIDAAVKAGVKRFIPAKFGWVHTPEIISETYTMFKTQAATLAYMRACATESNFSWTMIATYSFLDYAILGCINGPCRTATRVGGGDISYRVCTQDSTATAVVGVLRQPSVSRNRTLTICDFEITQNMLLQHLQTYYPGHWNITDVELDEFKQNAERDARPDNIDALHRLHLAYLLSGHDSHEPLANDVLKIPSRTLEGALAQIMRKK